MNTLRSHIVTRLVWIIIGTSGGAILLTQGFNAHLIGQSLTGIGLVFLGIGGFMHPVLFRSRFPPSLATVTSQENAIGSQSIRNSINFAALACLLIGLLLRYVFHV